jgi:hypothetical protein
MRYLVLIYENEDAWGALPREEQRRQIDGYDDVRRRAEAAGHLVAADGLASVRQAKTVRRRNGRVTTTDGPFAETKEQLGGFYLLECEERDALAYAAAIPAAVSGSVEVRPVGVPH